MEGSGSVKKARKKKTNPTRVASPTPADQSLSPLLSLPGELRDLIYEYSLEPSGVKVVDTAKAVLVQRLRKSGPNYNRRFGFRSKPRYTYPNRSNESYVPHMPLTQVCRQIRAECLPMYRRSKVKVPFEDISRYLKTFYPSTDPEIMAQYQGSLEIIAKGGWSDKTIDFFPVIKLCWAAPKFSCKFANMDLVFTKFNKRWQHHVSPCISKVELRFQRDELWNRIVFKREPPTRIIPISVMDWLTMMTPVWLWKEMYPQQPEHPMVKAVIEFWNLTYSDLIGWNNAAVGRVAAKDQDE